MVQLAKMAILDLYYLCFADDAVHLNADKTNQRDCGKVKQKSAIRSVQWSSDFQVASMPLQYGQ